MRVFWIALALSFISFSGQLQAGYTEAEEPEFSPNFVYQTLAKAGMLKQMAKWTFEDRVNLMKDALREEPKELAEKYQDFTPEQLARLQTSLATEFKKDNN